MAVPARRARQLPPKPRPRLAPVPPRGQPRRRPGRRARRIPFLLFSLAVVAGMVLLLTSAQALVAQGAFRVSALSEQADRLAVETNLMRLRLAELSSPGRVMAAGRRAGLVPRQQVEVLGP